MSRIVQVDRKALVMTGQWYPNAIGPLLSRGTKPPRCRAKVALRQDKQMKLPFKIKYAFCLSCLSATFALQHHVNG